MVDGMTDTEFAPRLAMNDQMFLTLALRVLGYQDGETENYVWNNARRLAYEAGLVASAEKDTEFTRGDAALVCWKALNCKLLGSTGTLADRLLYEGLFAADQYAEAEGIWNYGSLPEEDVGNIETPQPEVHIPSSPDPEIGGDHTEAPQPGVDDSGSPELDENEGDIDLV